MAKYMTAQRRKLINFLEAHPDKQFSAKEISEQLQDEGISLSAIYRNLSALEESGLIAALLREGIRDKYYRCLTSEECQCCIHLSCLKCGKTFHMDENAAETLIQHTRISAGFQINTLKSVLYGLCRNCV